MKLLKGFIHLLWMIGVFAVLGLIAWYVITNNLYIYVGASLTWIIGGAILGFLVNLYSYHPEVD